MPKAFDGTVVPEFLDRLPCGGHPRWDYGSEAGYRCEDCMAMIGSIGMPCYCKELLDEEENRRTVIKTMGFKDEELD